MGFGVAAHGDIADGRGDENALGALQRAEHDLDGKLALILAQSVQLDAGADLLGQRLGGGAGAVGDEPLGKAHGDDVGDFLAEQLIAAVAELGLGAGVEDDDFSALVDHDHAIRSGLHETAVAAFHLGQVFFGVLADGDVADGGRQQDSFGTFQRTEHNVDGKLASILA